MCITIFITQFWLRRRPDDRAEDATVASVYDGFDSSVFLCKVKQIIRHKFYII